MRERYDRNQVTFPVLFRCKLTIQRVVINTITHNNQSRKNKNPKSAWNVIAVQERSLSA